MQSPFEFIFGKPLPTLKLSEERLDKVRALAVLSPDALSSIAYANQEIYLGLVVAGSVGLNYSIPIAVAIALLLLVLTLSYFQTIAAYPTGGGSYTVASENLGKLPGQIAAAALLTDYVLTAAVSLTAGVAALASAFPMLWEYRVILALGLLLIITVANLRGLRDSGTIIAIPVYLFVFSYLAMIAYGIIRAFIEGPASVAVNTIPSAEPVTLFLILHTFSSGCTALTGVEAISNGVTVFKEPETRHARQTLVVMAVLMGLLLMGSIGLTQYFAITVGAEETILSGLARHIFGTNIFYYFMQLTMLLILIVAANTSYVDFPRVAQLLARDKYLPQQLTNLGDRLVFSNGIILLSVLVAFLIIIFNGDSHALIPLFAVGVFLAFSLSQMGMVVHWFRVKGNGWQLKALFNGLGAVTTTITFFVVAVSKFLEGAWIIAVLIPLLIIMFRLIESHYKQVAPQLSLQGLSPTHTEPKALRVVLPISGVHRGVLKALEFARSISDHVTAVYIELEPNASTHVKAYWEIWGQGVPLVVVPSPYRELTSVLLAYLDEADAAAHDGQRAAIVIPEFIPAHWWENFLHNQSAWMLKLALLYQRRLGSGRVVIDVPFHLRN